MNKAQARRMLQVRLKPGWSRDRTPAEATAIYERLMDAKAAAQAVLDRAKGKSTVTEGWIIEMGYCPGRLVRIEELAPARMRVKYIDMSRGASWWCTHTAYIDGATPRQSEMPGGLRIASAEQAQAIADAITRGSIAEAYSAASVRAEASL